MKYRQKPVVVEAIKWTGNWSEISAWLDEIFSGGLIFQPGQLPPLRVNDDGELVVETLHGPAIADVGEWVVRGVVGDLYPRMDDIFEATHEWVE